MTVETTFAVSGQHYLFNVQTFAHTVLALGGDAYAYALRDRTTQGVIDDVAGGKSDLGVLFQTSATADEVNAALDAAGLEFVELIQSAPRVALPKSHPMVNASSLSLEDMEDFPYRISSRTRIRRSRSPRKRWPACRAPRASPAPTARRCPS